MLSLVATGIPKARFYGYQVRTIDHDVQTVGRCTTSFRVDSKFQRLYQIQNRLRDGLCTLLTEANFANYFRIGETSLDEHIGKTAPCAGRPQSAGAGKGSLMAKAVAARLQGDDYQIRFFWLHACRLFEHRTKVVSVELESDDAKSLDDVVVRYNGYSDMGERVDADYYQVKFHVTEGGAFTWQKMMDPSFVNASAVSILQRLLNVQRKHAPEGHGCRFSIFSPWTAHPDDELATFLSLSDGRIRWDILGQGGPRSKMGKVREQWKLHLGLGSDEELRRLLNLVRLRKGPTLERLGEDLNTHLRLVGLVPVQQGSVVNPYDDLGRKFIERGQKAFSRNAPRRNLPSVRPLGLGRTLDASLMPYKLRIRSFWRYAEHLEDENPMPFCAYFAISMSGSRKNLVLGTKSMFLPRLLTFYGRM